MNHKHFDKLKDLHCPYCDHEEDINEHEHYKTNTHECSKCKKCFTFILDYLSFFYCSKIEEEV